MSFAQGSGDRVGQGAMRYLSCSQGRTRDHAVLLVGKEGIVVCDVVERRPVPLRVRSGHGGARALPGGRVLRQPL